ncbi:Arm DNA-binding domain-containing protein [Gloeothece verrucosa]|nr:DUF3596 domain-containing protein [Gloeothece verrucosa]
MLTNHEKAKNKSVIVQSNRGWLRLQLPRLVARQMGKERAFIYLGLADTPENRQRAEIKAKLIQDDILHEEFDFSLEKYKPSSHPKLHLTVVQSINKKELSTIKLFEKYLEFKQSTLKESSLHYLRTSIYNYLEKCPCKSLDKPLDIRAWFLENTTNSMTKRILTHLNAAVKWGIKYKLINLKISPFEGMSQELPPHNWEKDPQPNAFTQAEKQAIIKAFEEHQGNWNGKGWTGFAYSYYAPLVKFWFMTGCRPSEGIGLTWGQIDEDCSVIIFNHAQVQLGGGRIVPSEGSKNSRYRKPRKFPCSQSLHDLLISIKPNNPKPSDSVFPSPKGKVINYSNFCKKAWDRIVDPIVRRNSTPYCCRDTFISEQIAQGISPEIIARWVDSSAETIRKHYLDDKLLGHLRPIDTF